MMEKERYAPLALGCSISTIVYIREHYLFFLKSETLSDFLSRRQFQAMMMFTGNQLFGFSEQFTPYIKHMSYELFGGIA